VIEGRDLTRRAVLEGAAAVGAASLVGPAAGIAAVLEQQEPVFSRLIGSLPRGVSPQLEAPHRFALIGIEWARPADARIELRTRERGRDWGPWAVGSVLGHGPDQPPAETHFGEAIWTGPADYVQLRSSRQVHGARLHFVRTPASPQASAAALPLAQPVLDAGPGQPPIIARSAWARGQAPPKFRTASYGAVRLAFVHHSQTPNGYGPGQVPSVLLGIFAYHRYARGFNDIAYNFAIDAFGRIWEARRGGIDLPVVGAQAGGYNTESTGVVVLGSFMGTPPSAAAIDALQRLLAWKLSLHGLPVLGRVTAVVDPGSAFYTPFRPGAHVSLPRIAGHRDGDSTDCPGNAFYARLPSIRPRVAELAGTPAQVTLAAPRGASIAGMPVALSGRLALRGGPPLAGAPIELQALTRTIATATTAADGSWAVAVPLTFNTLLRALHRARPATVSRVVEVGVAPQLMLTVDSVSPLVVSGSVSPPKRRVTIELRAGARRVATAHVRLNRGRFSATLGTPSPGSYQLVARTKADARNVAGSTAPVPLMV
jgi:hypothetical protein